MLLLASTSDKLQVVTFSGGAIATVVHASWADLNGSTVLPGRTNTSIVTGTTTDVVASPAGSTYRTIKTLCIRNTHASSSCTTTVTHTDGTTAVSLFMAIIGPLEELQYHEGVGFWVIDSSGRSKTVASVNATAALNAMNIVVLASDVINNNGTANTIQDVTGLSFSVNAGETYQFRFTIDYTAAAGATGSRWSVSGPGSPTRLAYRSNYALTTTTETLNAGLGAYDLPAASNATTPVTTGNIAIVEGLITPSSSGTVIARFASEVLSSAITAKAGSTLQWIRTL